MARKARKFLAQGGRLTLPGYEAIYMLWTGFDCFHHERMPSIVSEIDAELAHLQSQSTTSTDDTCLAHFLRGLALKQFATPFNKTLIPAIDLIHLKPSLVKQSHLKKALKEFGTVVSLSGRLDTDLYLLPFARFECALVYQRLGEYDKAMYEAKAAGRGGALSNEKRSVTGKKKAFSMDLLLGLKVHNLKLKLEILDRLSGWKGEKSDEIWAAYSTTSQ